MPVTKIIGVVRLLASPGSKRTLSTAGLSRRVKVVVIGSGRMGLIRSSLIYANPRFELCGIIDVNIEGAATVADTFGVRNKHSPCQRRHVC